MGKNSPQLAFGTHVQRARQIAGLSARGLAKRLRELGYVTADHKLVRNIETGKANPTIEHLLGFAAALDVSPTDLVLPPQEDAEVSIANLPAITSDLARIWFTGISNRPDAMPMPIRIAVGASNDIRGMQVWLGMRPDVELISALEAQGHSRQRAIELVEDLRSNDAAKTLGHPWPEGQLPRPEEENDG